MLLRQKAEQYISDLLQQLTSASRTLPFLSSIEIIDQRLKEFVRLHHFDLVRTIYYQMNKFKDMMQEKTLFQQLSSLHLSSEQVL
jgi:hypothetical protein